MSIFMYKSNREKKDISFWGRKDIFYHSVQFDKNTAIKYFHTLKLDESEKCLFIEEFIKFYLQYPINQFNHYWFNKSVELIEELIGVDIEKLYKFSLEHIGSFNKKEDFEFFYYFKSLDILQQGYNNIFLELLNWFSHHEKGINLLLENNNNKKEPSVIPQFLLLGTTGVGKSLYLKQTLLKEDCIIISQKEMGLKNFYEEDKQYFYELFINLTNKTNLNDLLQQIESNKNDLEFKGVASYLEKRVRFEMLSEKMSLKKDKKNTTNTKVFKI